MWAIDPTGKFILEEKLRTKLLMVPEPLKIALVTRGQLGENYELTSSTGWCLLRHRMGNASPQNFGALDDLLKALEAES